MTPIQKALLAARRVVKRCTIPAPGQEGFQVVIKQGSYESLLALARAMQEMER